jgi:transposase InsO family protein
VYGDLQRQERHGRVTFAERKAKETYDREPPWRSIADAAPLSRHDLRSPVQQHGITCSMSRSGNVWDNAAMESFFSH